MKQQKSFVQSALDLGFGLLSTTRDRMEKVSADLVKRGELSRNEAKKWLSQVEKELDQEMKFLDKKVQKGIKDFIQKVKVPSRTEFEKLSREVSRLKKEVTRLRTKKRSSSRKT